MCVCGYVYALHCYNRIHFFFHLLLFTAGGTGPSVMLMLVLPAGTKGLGGREQVKPG